jgi:hypothetical protein
MYKLLVLVNSHFSLPTHNVLNTAFAVDALQLPALKVLEVPAPAHAPVGVPYSAKIMLLIVCPG